MNINLTLLGEVITFAVLVLVTMKYIWPPITKAMQERQQKIKEGLDAAERGHKSLDLAQEKIKKQLRDTRQDAAKIIDAANRRMTEIIESAKIQADAEGKKVLEMAHTDIAHEMDIAKEKLREQFVVLVVQAAEKILKDHIDAATNKRLIDEFIAEI